MKWIDTALLSRDGLSEAWHNFCVRQNRDRPQRVGMQLRILAALTTLLVLVLSSRSTFAAVDIQGAQDPVLVAMTVEQPLTTLQPHAASNAALRRQTTAAVLDVAKRAPGRMITIDVRRSPLRFARLSDDVRASIETRHGRSAAQWYEQSMAELLTSVVRDVKRSRRDLRLSVLGLPIEARNADALRANTRYAALLSELDALVSAKQLIIARTANEAAMAESALPEAMRYSNGRPVFYRANNTWRMATPSSGSDPSSHTDHTAQDGMELQAIDVLRDNPDVAALLRDHGIDLDQDPDADAEQSRSGSHDALMQLLADWGQTDSPWDLNEDGTVDIFDLQILLRDWQQYDDQPTTGVARFVYVPDQYTLGSGMNIDVQLLDDAPADPNVVFQVWSNETNSIEAAYPDFDAPFAYPASALDQVTPGMGEIQALIRNADDDVVLLLAEAVEFVPDPWGGDADPDDPDDDPNGDDDEDNPPDDDPGDDDPSDDPNDDPGDDPQDDPGDDPQDDPGDDPNDDPDQPDADEPWTDPLADLDPELVAHLQDVTLPTQPDLDNPQQITVSSVNDIPHPIGNNRIITIVGVVEIDNPEDGFIFNLGASDVVVRFEDGAQLRYTGGRSHRGLFQFRSTAARIRIENPVIVGPTGTMDTCHAFATMLGDGTCSDITIVGGDISGIRYTVQGEGGCERFLITGVHAHDNREYFVWGSNGLVDATICHNIIDGVVQEHGIRLAPGVDRVNIVSNDIRIRQEGLLKRTIWIPGAHNVSIIDNHTRDGRITIGPDPTANEPGPQHVILAGNRIEHERNNLAIELFSGARDVLVSLNEVTTPHSNWMQVGTQDPFDRPFENIHWTEDNIANGIERHGYDGVRVSPGFAGDPTIGPIQ